MPWFKVDDKFHDHRKLRTLGVSAVGLWTLAGSWSADNLEDGFVPDHVCARWDKGFRVLAQKLVDAGLWDVASKHGEDGWQFHEWDEFQPTRAKVLADREAAKQRQRSRRMSRRDTPRDARRESHDPDPTRPSSLTGGEGRAPCFTCGDKGWIIAEDTSCPTCQPREATVTDIDSKRHAG